MNEVWVKSQVSATLGLGRQGAAKTVAKMRSKRALAAQLTGVFLLVGVGATGCDQPPALSFRATGKIVFQDCLTEGDPTNPVDAVAHVISTFPSRRGAASVLQARERLGSEDELIDWSAYQLQERTSHFVFDNENKEEIGKRIRTLTMTEKPEGKSGARCARTQQIRKAVLRTECPVELVSTEKCASRLEVFVFSNLDEEDRRQPLVSFRSIRVKHAQNEQPFQGTFPR
jgi:hypothetical protein